MTGRDTVSHRYFLRSSGRISYWASDGCCLLDPSTGEALKVATDGFIGDFDRREEIALLRHDTPLASWDTLDLKSGKRTPLLRAEHWPLYLAHFSPDDRWIISAPESNV